MINSYNLFCNNHIPGYIVIYIVGFSIGYIITKGLICMFKHRH